MADSFHADLVLFVLPGKRAAHARLGSGRRSRCHQGKQTQIEHVTEYVVNQGLEDGRGVDRGMTKYSKCPIGVLKAVFHSSPSRMQTRWSAFSRSSLMNIVAPCKGIYADLIRGRGYLFLSVHTPEVNTWSQGAVLHPHKEKPCIDWRGGGSDSLMPGNPGYTPPWLCVQVKRL